MIPITFTVIGLPKPAGSKRAFALKKGGVYTGRAVVTDDCKTSRDWKTDVKHAAVAIYQREPLACAVRLTLVFVLPRPRGHFGTGRNVGVLKPSAALFHVIKPDVLKLARGVEDALTGIIWKDDSQIVEEYLEKRYTQPGETPGGVQIRIEDPTGKANEPEEGK